MIITDLECECSVRNSVIANFCTYCGLPLSRDVLIEGSGVGPIFEWHEFKREDLQKGDSIGPSYDNAAPLSDILGKEDDTVITDWVQNAEYIFTHLPRRAGSGIVIFNISDIQERTDPDQGYAPNLVLELEGLAESSLWVEPILCGNTTLYQINSDKVVGFDLSRDDA